ncbi:hypothetical protein HMI56_000071 [Coelomomyces lativittatus]|nr:hypothetical protein HMI56_000071 [Coelomomyces lativittatus]
MAKKKKKFFRPWCWYCDRDFEDEKVLLQHQKQKHFRCLHCPKKFNTAGGMVIHVMQVHKEIIKTVPNALPGHDNVDLEIFGMEGVPENDLKRKVEEFEASNLPRKKKKTLKSSSTSQEFVADPSFDGNGDANGDLNQTFNPDLTLENKTMENLNSSSSVSTDPSSSSLPLLQTNENLATPSSHFLNHPLSYLHPNSNRPAMPSPLSLPPFLPHGSFPSNFPIYPGSLPIPPPPPLPLPSSSTSLPPPRFPPMLLPFLPPPPPPPPPPPISTSSSSNPTTSITSPTNANANANSNSNSNLNFNPSSNASNTIPSTSTSPSSTTLPVQLPSPSNQPTPSFPPPPPPPSKNLPLPYYPTPPNPPRPATLPSNFGGFISPFPLPPPGLLPTYHLLHPPPSLLHPRSMMHVPPPPPPSSSSHPPHASMHYYPYPPSLSIPTHSGPKPTSSSTLNTSHSASSTSHHGRPFYYRNQQYINTQTMKLKPPSSSTSTSTSTTTPTTTTTSSTTTPSLSSTTSSSSSSFIPLSSSTSHDPAFNVETLPSTARLSSEDPSSPIASTSFHSTSKERVSETTSSSIQDSLSPTPSLHRMHEPHPIPNSTSLRLMDPPSCPGNDQEEDKEESNPDPSSTIKDQKSNLSSGSYDECT